MGVSGLTLTPGLLRVAAAFPDPPFDVPGEPPSGFDVELMRQIASELGLACAFVRFQGEDFNDIFAGLADRAYDVVASGATVTEHRRTLARFCRPYLRSGQSLVVNTERHPKVRSVDDLAGLNIGVQHGNTSEPVARRLEVTGKLASVRVYAYHDILSALGDLEGGRLDAFMKLEPVARWLIRDRPALRVVQTGITDERLAVAAALGNPALARAIDDVQASLGARGVLKILGQRWFEDGQDGTEVLG